MVFGIEEHHHDRVGEVHGGDKTHHLEHDGDAACPVVRTGNRLGLVRFLRLSFRSVSRVVVGAEGDDVVRSCNARRRVLSDEVRHAAVQERMNIMVKRPATVVLDNGSQQRFRGNAVRQPRAKADLPSNAFVHAITVAHEVWPSRAQGLPVWNCSPHVWKHHQEQDGNKPAEHAVTRGLPTLKYHTRGGLDVVAVWRFGGCGHV